MNKLPETVTTKFTELFFALHNATDDLKIAGAEANLIGDFSQVANLNDLCQKLQALDAEIKSTVNNFDAKYNNRQSVTKGSFRKKDRNRMRKPSARFIVCVANTIIEEPTIAQTFLKALRLMGLDRVAKLNKVVSSAPLVAKFPVNSYQKQMPCDGWYVTTHVNQRTASTILEEIGKELNMSVKVEFIGR